MSRALALVLVVASAVLGPAAATTAQAADGGAGPSTSRPHCVIEAQGVSASSAAAPTRCFKTFADAVADATDGRVVLDPDETVLEDKDLLPILDDNSTPVMAGPMIIGVEYQHAAFGGWTLTIVGGTTTAGCSTGKTFRVSGLAASYDNQISSARTYGGCKSRHYSNANFSGSSYLCGCSSMGAMSDRTSSIYFSRTG